MRNNNIEMSFIGGSNEIQFLTSNQSNLMMRIRGRSVWKIKMKKIHLILYFQTILRNFFPYLNHRRMNERKNGQRHQEKAAKFNLVNVHPSTHYLHFETIHSCTKSLLLLNIEQYREQKKSYRTEY